MFMTAISFNHLLHQMKVVLTPHFKDEEREALRG